MVQVFKNISNFLIEKILVVMLSDENVFKLYTKFVPVDIFRKQVVIRRKRSFVADEL